MVSSGMKDEYYDGIEQELSKKGVDMGPKESDNQIDLQENLLRISKALIELCVAKNRIYGGSYCKHGETLGIFSNVTRKYDRLEMIMMEGRQVGSESKATTVADLANYSLLWLEWLMNNKPEEFNGLIAELKEWEIEL